MAKRRKHISKEVIEDLYHRQSLSLRKISQIVSISVPTLMLRFKEFNIVYRSKSSVQTRYKKIDFNGDEVIKAYMLGFRIGDLNVYTRGKDSELIVARCNTTQEEQVAVLRQLFSKYGHVQVSKGKKSRSINCHLNPSFDFLLAKFSEVPEWIEQKNKFGLAFIAGYIDAEGNFSINQSRARLKIDSYDYEVLKWITKWLYERGYKSKFWKIGVAGELRTDGTRFKKDLWRLNINDAVSLLLFIEQLLPYMMHKNRIKQAVLCRNNIDFRINRRSVKINYVTA